jgi:hypothetical protein
MFSSFGQFRCLPASSLHALCRAGNGIVLRFVGDLSKGIDTFFFKKNKKPFGRSNSSSEK